MTLYAYSGEQIKSDRRQHLFLEPAQHMTKDKKPTPSIANFAGGTLIAIGILLIVLQRFGEINIGEIWPFFVIVPGAAMMGAALLSSKGNQSAAAVGAAITATGLLLLYQTRFGHFESWAYAWALVFPFAPGIGLVLHGKKADDTALVEKGKWAIFIGIAAFAVGLIFFEVIIGISGKAIFDGLRDTLVWPVLMIGAGFGLLLIKRRK